MGLPEVEPGVSWGDRPAHMAPRGERGRGFVLRRAPRHTAVDPATGEPTTDLLVMPTGSPGDKAALVGDPGSPLVTVPHVDRSNAVLVRTSRLREISRSDRDEVLVQAWFSRAPKCPRRVFADRRKAP